MISSARSSTRRSLPLDLHGRLAPLARDGLKRVPGFEIHGGLGAPVRLVGTRRRSREYDFSRTVIAAESTCERGRVVGAVVFSDTDILSFGGGQEGRP